MGSITTITIASRLEESDVFCASCHMTPEQTYHQRAQAVLDGKPASDLSSFHYQTGGAQTGASRPFRCADCHRGDQHLVDRASALTVGAKDILLYLLGKPDQTIEKRRVSNAQLIDDSCLNCHLGTALTVGFQNHFHNKLPAAYMAWHQGAALVLPKRNPDRYRSDVQKGLELLDVNIACLDCHRAHVMDTSSDQPPFMDLKTDVYPMCEVCHQKVLGHAVGVGLPE